jgi:hypothetical protein
MLWYRTSIATEGRSETAVSAHTNQKLRRRKSMQIRDIETSILSKIVGSDISKWRIGLTNDLRVRYEHWRETENQKLLDWDAWEADSLSDAQALEASFI